MSEYRSFTEYLQNNYKDVIEENLIPFILSELSDITIDGVMHHFEDVEVNNLRIRGVKYTKSEIDKVEFECLFTAEYLMTCNDVFPPLVLEDQNNSFSCYFKGSFSSGFKLCDKEIELIDEEEFDQKLTNTLVPVIPKDKMDKYASKFLKYFCPEALKTPMKLDLKKMLNDKGVYYYKAPLGDKIFGKTFFAEDEADVYDNENNVITMPVKKGTILINYDTGKKRKLGFLRNTIVHEAVHWFFHRNYFELRQLLDNSLTCAVCYRGELDYENEEIAWMERQARALSPKILMPKKQTIVKYKELTKEIDEEAKECGWSRIEKWEQMIKRISSFFGVSIQLAKYRLKELGYTRADGVYNYIDGHYIDGFSFKSGYLCDHQTFVINNKSFVNLLKTNREVYNAFNNFQLLFINNMIVVNHPKYVDNKNHCLTQYALEHAHECCLLFNVCSELDMPNNCNEKHYFLYSSANNRSTQASVDSEQLAVMIGKVSTDSIHYEMHKSKLPASFNETLEYHFKKSKFTQEEFADESDINVKYIRSFLKGEKRPSEIQVIKMSIALRLSFPYLNDLIKKNDQMIISFGSTNSALLATLIPYSRLGMEDIYKALKSANMEDLLQLSDNYLENHNLI